MNVGDLIKELSFYDADMEIVVASDEEGNNFNRLSDIDESFATFHEYEINLHHPDDIEEMEDYEREEFVKVLCIWP